MVQRNVQLEPAAGTGRLCCLDTSTSPVVLITGAAGAIGSALADWLMPDYRVVGMDLKAACEPFEIVALDLTSDQAVEAAFARLRERYGTRLAAVIHLAAYFDFTGEQHPLYEKVNVSGTRRLLRALRDFEVERFVYSGTMLVHRPGRPGEYIDESAPIEPAWAYPKSKAAAEDVIRAEHGSIPYALLHLAGLYDERTVVPTLAHQIARIYERNLQSRLFPGNPDAGQSFIHRDDMMDAFRRVVDRRRELPAETTLLVGEPEAVGFEELQQQLGNLIHGEQEWATLRIPPPLARAGAWVQEKAEPLVPDAIDRGEKPFIRPFMIGMAQDHYALDISRARELLGWTPRHDIRRVLPTLVAHLKEDPIAWYRLNKVPPPAWLETADEVTDDPELLRSNHENKYRSTHARFQWAHYANMGLATWLISSPMMLDHGSAALAASDMIAGIALLVLAAMSVRWRFGWARWGCGLVGVWLLFAPLVFWAPNAASYLNDTLLGMLAIGLATASRPAPGVSPVAARSGSVIPSGWDFSPSGWTQRVLIIALAFLGLHISRTLAAYQLGHIDAVWEPFFSGTRPGLNGTEDIVTSRVSEAWPIPDAGLGGVVYALEILAGLVGSARRWRTMPWLVTLFGALIVPLGVVSITFIIIQPIVIGTWCTLCLIAAAAMLIQIPYAVDELVATGQFLRRRKRTGRSLLLTFLLGDTDEGAADPRAEQQQASTEITLRSMIGGGVGAPWNLLVCIAIGVWLMFTRLTLGTDGTVADADHLVGALVVTVSVIALAEVTRAARFINIPLGLGLAAAPFLYDASTAAMANQIVCGLAIVALSIRRGAIRARYGTWDKLLV